MKILFQTVLCATFLVSSAFHSFAQVGQEAYFELSDQFFKTNVDEAGNVDYESIVKDTKSLDQLTSIISNYDFFSVSVIYHVHKVRAVSVKDCYRPKRDACA